MNIDTLRKTWALTLLTFNNFISDSNIAAMARITDLLSDAFKNGNKVIIAGNGGSACDAMHFAEEFTGRFRKDRQPLPVLSLNDPAHITCVGNDYGFNDIFARSVDAFGKTDDIFIAISTSGNSENIIKAVAKAREKGMYVVCLLGRDGGQLKNVGDYNLIVDGQYSDKIQEVHMAILHILIESVEENLGFLKQ